MISYFKFLLTFFICSIAVSSFAQTFKTPVEYMSYISTQQREITENFMSYTSSVAHGKSARKIDNRRKELIGTVQNTIKKVSAMPPYEGDKAYRDSALAYLKITYLVLNDDYEKIVNMEEIAEQSYDAMEAYMLAKDKAGEKMDHAFDQFQLVENQFAKNHNVNLISSQDELSKKMAQTARTSKYHRMVYLVFFKAYKQEMYLFDATEKRNIASMEQNKNTLAKYASEGLSKLDTMKAFDGDKSLIEACRQAMNFYKKECNENVAVYSNYFI